MKGYRVSWTIFLLAFVLLTGVMTDQSICFSCPADLPFETSFNMASGVDAELACSVCVTRLIPVQTRDAFPVLERFDIIPPARLSSFLPVIDPVYHPPRH